MSNEAINILSEYSKVADIEAQRLFNNSESSIKPNAVEYDRMSAGRRTVFSKQMTSEFSE